jgi:L-aminopeptidase/D-esterase-like protein
VTPRSSIIAVAGVQVGHWTGAGTGVTVVLLPPETVASGEIGGGAPASRETALLDPSRTVAHADAICFSGGSAFGLAAADGVMSYLAEHGRGFPTRGGPVPIVPTASIYDLVEAGGDRPDAAAGRAAAEAASRGEELETGRVGAARGATIGKWRGAEHAVPGGLGSAATRVGDATVGALAIVNAIGDVIGADGRVVAGSTAPADADPFPEVAPFEAGGNTTLVLVATDATFTKAECHLLAQSGHHGLARAIHPSHTRYDGDLVVAVATGTVDGQLDRVRVAATDVVATAVRDAVTAREADPGRGP